MTSYSPDNLAKNWEFKMLRSASGGFANTTKLRRILEEEARAGWVMLEKFDNERLRLKRPIAARRGDAQLGFDPYRTWVGIGPGGIALLIVGLALLFAALIAAVPVLLGLPLTPLGFAFLVVVALAIVSPVILAVLALLKLARQGL